MKGTKMGYNIKEKNILIAVAGGYDEHEFWFPYYRFKEAKANVIVAAPKKETIYSGWAKNVLPAEVDYDLHSIRDMEFDGIFIPGGLLNPLELRVNEAMLDILRKANRQNKWIAAICHAPWVLVSAGLVKGKKIAAPADMADDISNAGGIYVGEGAVKDGNIYTAVYYALLPELFRLLLGEA